jgi:hypothetical protein
VWTAERERLLPGSEAASSFEGWPDGLLPGFAGSVAYAGNS